MAEDNVASSYTVSHSLLKRCKSMVCLANVINVHVKQIFALVVVTGHSIQNKINSFTIFSQAHQSIYFLESNNIKLYMFNNQHYLNIQHSKYPGGGNTI